MSNNLKNIKKIFRYNSFFIIFIFLFLIFIDYAFALEINYPRLPFSDIDPPQVFTQTAPKEQHLSLYIKYFFYLTVWIVGLMALGSLIIAGIRYLISFGKPESIIAAKEHIFSVFLGLLIILSTVLIFNVINPQILILELKKLVEPIKVKKSLIAGEPPKPYYRTLANTEIPFGRIIEIIFETKDNMEYSEFQERKPRMDRIKENASTTLKIVQRMDEQNKNLKEAAHRCTCGKPNDSRPLCCDPKPGYAATLYGNGCESKESCTSDSCSTVRGTMEDLEDKNLKDIDKLKEEQNKTEQEMNSLREWLKRLELAEEKILSCNREDKKEKDAVNVRVYGSQSGLVSYKEFLGRKNEFINKGWLYEIIKIWDDIKIDYDVPLIRNGLYQGQTWAKSRLEKGRKTNWDTFYCFTSGSIYGEKPLQFASDSERELSLEAYNENVQREDPKSTLERRVEEYKVTCKKEASVGEVIDRSKRITIFMLQRMDRMLDLGKQMIEATENMHNLISQCSSRRCDSVCEGECGKVCIKTCVASLRYPEGPCPLKDIDEHYEKIISEIRKNMDETIQGKNEEERTGSVANPAQSGGEETGSENRTEIGMIPLIDKVVAKLLEDLKLHVRDEMYSCFTASESEEAFLTGQGEERETALRLTNCTKAINAMGPERLIENCCYDQEEFNECLGSCYLEEGQEKYKKCLNKCLNEKSKELDNQGEKIKSRVILTCQHELNFYCCSY